MNELKQNEVELEGTVHAAPVFSHENHGTAYYRFPLRVPRLSGQADLLPVLLPEALLPRAAAGASLHLRGQLRSFNNKSGSGSRLVLTVHALSLHSGSGGAVNRILLSGILCKPPSLRRTPLGRSICDLMLAVPRRYGRTDYLPVIAWGRLAASVCGLAVGDRITVEGRIQSRVYTKVTPEGAEERTAYEVSVMRLLEDGAAPAAGEAPAPQA